MGLLSSSSSKKTYQSYDNSVAVDDNSIADSSLNDVDAGESVYNLSQLFAGGGTNVGGSGGGLFGGTRQPAMIADISISDASADVIDYAGDLAAFQVDALTAVNDQGGRNLTEALNFAEGVVSDSNYFAADTVDSALSFGGKALYTAENVAGDALSAVRNTAGDALYSLENTAGDALSFGRDAIYSLEGTAGDALSFGGDALYTVQSLARDSLAFGGNVIAGLFDSVRYTIDEVTRGNIAAQNTVMNVAGEAIRAADETTNERTTKTALYMAGAVTVAVLIAWGMKR